LKKIHVVVDDDFDTEEDACSFRAEVTARLRTEHPGTIVQVDHERSLREHVVLHAYGFFADDDKRLVEEAATRSVVEILESQVSSSLLAPDPSDASPEDPTEEQQIVSENT
jgi:hypothetical protein